MLLKRRIDHIVHLANDVVSLNNSTVDDGQSTIESTLKVFKYIAQLYLNETRQMCVTDNLDLTLLTEIIATVQKIMDLNEFPDEIRYRNASVRVRLLFAKFL